MVWFRRLSLFHKLLLAVWLVPAAALGLAALWSLHHSHALSPDRDLVLVLGLPAAALLVGVLVSGIITRRVARSVRSMIEAAEAIGLGRFERRITFHPGRELEMLAASINRMAERIAEHIAATTEQKEKLQAVLDGMWDGVMVLDRAGRIRSVNRSMALIAHAGEQALGKRPLEVLACPELQDACERMLEAAGRTASSLALSMGERTFEVNVIRPCDGGLGLGLILVFHDISEMKRLEAVRRDFAANVSHELRTPLTAIKGYAETLLSDTPPPPELAFRFLGVILKNADHMSKMVKDLLSLSRLEAGDQAPNVGPVNPRDALTLAWEAVEGLAKEKNITLEDHLPADPPRALADRDQLAQVFRNLLENAVRFSPPGQPVHVSLRPQAPGEAALACFEVRDLGPGIPKKDQPRIFERFYSVQKHRSNEYGSTGLGLAICRHIVRNLGGEIRVESPPCGYDAGTSFVFLLPAVPAAAEPPAAALASNAAQG